MKKIDKKAQFLGDSNSTFLMEVVLLLDNIELLTLNTRKADC